jgi:redox-sensitive bicupin YhaK (pirin superfamily)
MKKAVLGVVRSPAGHWVGDGFPVRTLFSYNGLAKELSPFLMLDYAGPAEFPPAERPRGVGEHPHRGFETVTIVYEGEVAHRDSAGNQGVIRAGDVQWMTAASGVVHDEFHSPEFSRRGGRLEMVQLWVNLPAAHKMSAPRYQAILSGDIPDLALPQDAGRLRLIAGAHAGSVGPAHTVTPMNVWDIRLNAERNLRLDLTESHTAALVVLRGAVRAGAARAEAAQMLHFSPSGTELDVQAETDSVLLLLSGAPIAEPIVGWGPFVMNSHAEIETAVKDYQAGRFGALPGEEQRKIARN